MELEKDWRQKYHFPYKQTNDEKGYQRNLVEDICQTARDGDTILLNASTGIGKTIAMISSAFTLLEQPDSGIERVIICPSNKSQHDNIQKELFRTLMKFPKLKEYKCVSLKGKNDLCSHEKATSPVDDFCRYLRKDNLCQHFNALTDKGSRIRKCEYYKRVREAKEAHLLVADYNYLLEDRFFAIIQSKIALSNTLVIFDEAHNLISRAISNLSDMKTQNSMESCLGELRICLNGVRDLIKAEKDPQGTSELKEDEIDIKAAMIVVEKLHKFLASEANRNEQKKELSIRNMLEKTKLSRDEIEFVAEVLNSQADYLEGLKEGQRIHIRALSGFLKGLLENSGKEEYLTCIGNVKKRDEQYYTYTLQCLDPSLALQRLISSATPMVLLSGTMKPFDYYKRCLGLEKAKEASYEAEFLKNNRKLLIYCPEYANFKRDFRYKHIEVKLRDLELMIGALSGNTACFFQSFADTYNYHKLLTQKGMAKNIHLHVQGGNRDAVLEKFTRSKDSVLLSVAGSGLAEGIDYEGEALKNAVLIGVPYPSYDLTARAQIKYYTKKFGSANARRYAYECPTLVTIQQAAGRVVRGPKERGLIILFDTRFQHMSLPKEYLENKIISRTELLKIAKKFWEKESWKKVFSS